MPLPPAADGVPREPRVPRGTPVPLFATAHGQDTPGPLGTSTPGNAPWALLSLGLNALSDAPQANEDMLEFCWKGFEQPVNKWLPAVFLRETAAPYSEIKNMLGEVKKNPNQQKNLQA